MDVAYYRALKRILNNFPTLRAKLLPSDSAIDSVFPLPQNLEERWNVYNTPFHFEALGLAVNSILHEYRKKTNNCEPHQLLNCDLAVISLRRERYLKKDGKPVPQFDELSGLYKTKDGKLISIHCNFAAHKNALMKAINFEPQVVGERTGNHQRKEVENAIALNWNAVDLDLAINQNGGACAIVRESLSFSPRLVESALVSITQAKSTTTTTTMERNSLSFNNSDDGVTIIDFTRVLAGPMCVFSLEEVLCNQIKSVYSIGGEQIEQIENIRQMVGKRKQSFFANLKQDVSGVGKLLPSCTFFVQSYRTGALHRVGLGFEHVRKINPSVVYITIRAYDALGGDSIDKRGFDSLVQCSSGLFAMHNRFLNPLQSASYKPGNLPVQALDHLAGYFACLGGLECYERNKRNVGNESAYHVEVSLERAALFVSEFVKERCEKCEENLNNLEARLPNQTVRCGNSELTYVPSPLELLSGENSQVVQVQQYGESGFL